MQAVLVEAVGPARGHGAQVEGGAPGAAQVPDPARDAGGHEGLPPAPGPVVGQPRPDHREVEAVRGRGAQRGTVEGGAVPARRAPHPPRDRLDHRPGDRHPVHLRADRHREPGEPAGVVHRAVDRVDDPAHGRAVGRGAGAPARLPARPFPGLLAEHGVARAVLGEPAPHEVLAGPVALGDDVGVRGLRVEPAGGAHHPLPDGEGQGGGLPGDGHGQPLEVLREIGHGAVSDHGPRPGGRRATPYHPRC